MQYRTLGNSGAVVSNYALGTMTFGAEATEEQSRAILDDYFAAGGNFIDTADVYSSGVSEEIIGRWLADRAEVRDRAVVATKGRFPMGQAPNDVGTSRRHLVRALDDSLRRLGVEQIDLYQLHAWDPVTPLEETLRFLHDAVTSGKIAYYGFSNFLGWQLTKAVHVAKAHGWSAPVTLQPQYSLLVREIESEIVPAALDAGIGLLPWSPLGGGLAVRQIQARPAAGRRHPSRRKPEARDGGLGGPQRRSAHLGRDRRGGADRRAPRRERRPRWRWPGWRTGRRSPR